jgi:Cu2+-containing amine oxidase
MSRASFAACLLVGAAVALFALPAGPSPGTGAQPPQALKPGAPPAQPLKPAGQPGLPAGAHEIEQTYPVGGAMQTAWKVRYTAPLRGSGLTITGAWFKTSPGANWLKVLDNIRLSEIFVPYNSGARIYDIGAQGNYRLLEHTADDAGPHGKVINEGRVVQEIRDLGPLWKFYKQVRRAQDLVLWSTMGASNYNYIMEYSFRGDGTVTCRLGSTGKNLPGHEKVGHMHHGCWRIDIDLDDPAHNSAFLVKRQEPKGQAKASDVVVPFNNGVEGGAAWEAREFTRLRVQSAKKNGQGKFMSYELVPYRPGTPRHWGGREAFAQHDFWVTPFRVNEQYYVELPRYVAQKRKITDTNLVVWYMSPAYHMPRDEDGLFTNPAGRVQVRGVAMTTWCGFELRPRNVFDKSPLYP